MARAIAVLGSGSDVGKSLVAVALCRIAADAGIDVVPFKAQNMANQAGVTSDGLEMPRAQILQALACRKPPAVDMGPVLMKPVSPTGAQIIVLGKSVGQFEAAEYFADTSRLAAVAAAALSRLLDRYACVILEGAGSPVELNLWDRDFVNLRSARQADARLVLVVDIDKGGVFAQVKGTLDLLPAADRARLLGVVVNRFRGDLSLFEDAIPTLERIAGTRVLAVVPYLDHGLDEEDRPIGISINARPKPDRLNVGVLLYPRVANTEDIHPLLAEPDLNVTFITEPRLIAEQQLLVLPGSKATVGDLVYLSAVGLTEPIEEAFANGCWLLGICGGYQMLGYDLLDPERLEGGPTTWQGLRMLPIDTAFCAEKVTLETRCESAWPERGHGLSGYEIHHGRTALRAQVGEPLVTSRGAEIGWRRERVVGSYLHGMLANDAWRSSFLNLVRRERGLAEQPIHPTTPLEQRIRRWAAHFRDSLLPGGLDALHGALGVHGGPAGV